MGIFQSLARGESYAGLARRLSLTVPALKSRIARSRARLRQLSARYRQARRSFAN
jgi:DNA-directed RNA polymerase specialized sigma24 family protein